MGGSNCYVDRDGRSPSRAGQSGRRHSEDTNTNLIWLQNWNLNGQKNWATQNAWAETTLDGFAGSNDWRLPEIGEYFALFTAYSNLSQVTASTNVQTSASYWSGTVFANDPSQTWIFSTSNGNRGVSTRSLEFYAVAVRRGDVTASVPEP